MAKLLAVTPGQWKNPVLDIARFIGFAKQADVPVDPADSSDANIFCESIVELSRPTKQYQKSPQKMAQEVASGLPLTRRAPALHWAAQCLLRIANA